MIYHTDSMINLLIVSLQPSLNNSLFAYKQLHNLIFTNFYFKYKIINIALLINRIFILIKI